MLPLATWSCCREYKTVECYSCEGKHADMCQCHECTLRKVQHRFCQAQLKTENTMMDLMVFKHKRLPMDSYLALS